MTKPSVKRRDALANEARIVAAAAQVLAARGLDATVPEIAARAGVGKATVYRNFPTKADLVAAIALERMASIHASIEQALTVDDPLDGLRKFLEELLLLQQADRGLGDALRHARRADVQAARVEVMALIDVLLGRCRTAGVVRHDATAVDIRVFVSGIANELTQKGETDLAVWRRYAALTADAFRP